MMNPVLKFKIPCFIQWLVITLVVTELTVPSFSLPEIWNKKIYEFYEYKQWEHMNYTTFESMIFENNVLQYNPCKKALDVWSLPSIINLLSDVESRLLVKEDNSLIVTLDDRNFMIVPAIILCIVNEELAFTLMITNFNPESRRIRVLSIAEDKLNNGKSIYRNVDLVFAKEIMNFYNGENHQAMKEWLLYQQSQPVEVLRAYCKTATELWNNLLRGYPIEVAQIEMGDYKLFLMDLQQTVSIPGILLCKVSIYPGYATPVESFVPIHQNYTKWYHIFPSKNVHGGMQTFTFVRKIDLLI